MDNLKGKKLANPLRDFLPDPRLISPAGFPPLEAFRLGGSRSDLLPSLLSCLARSFGGYLPCWFVFPSPTAPRPAG